MSINTLAGNEYALGLSWVEIEGKKVASSAEAIAKDINKKLGVIHKGLNYVQVGLTDDNLLKGLQAAASVFCEISENDSAIIIEKLEGDKYWICAISDRKVIIGGDKVLEHQQAQYHLEELGAIYNESSELANIYINEINLGVFRLPFSEEHIVLADFGELLEAAPSGRVTKLKVRSLESNSKALLLLLGFVAASACLGYVIVAPEAEPEEVYYEPLPVSAAVLQAEEEKKTAKILDAAYQEELGWLTEGMSKKSPRFINEQIMRFAAELPKFIGGWTAVTINYNEEMPEYLSVRWEKEEGGTTLTLKNAINANVSFNLKGLDAVSQHKVIRLSDRKYENLIDYIRAEKYKHIEMMHDLESLKYSWKMSNHNSGPRNVKIQGIADAQKSMERQLNLVAKDYTVSGEGLYSLSNINLIFEKAKTAKINEITVNLKDDYKWTINGVIYEN